MKTISLIFVIVAAIQLALAAPDATDEATKTYDTPFGKMDLDQLTEHYLNYVYHKYDKSVQYVKNVINNAQEKIDGFLDKTENSQHDNDLYKRTKSLLENFLHDIENETFVKECGLERIGSHHTVAIRNFASMLDNKEIDDLSTGLRSEFRLTPGDDTDRDIYYYIRDNKPLILEVVNNAEFDAVCCQFKEQNSRRYQIKENC